MTPSLRPQLVSLLLLVVQLYTRQYANALRPPKAIAVTGANKGQGFALCQRILEEHDDTFVFLCARDSAKGAAAVQTLINEDGHGPDRVQAVTLDVTDGDSVRAAAAEIQTVLGDGQKLHGLVSNAGILWGYSLEEQFRVNARGVRTVLDAFLPLMEGKMIVVSSGLGPLMHSFSSAENKEVLNKDDLEWEDLEALIEKCLAVDSGPDGFEEIGFSGGPFSEAVPDFHMYGLAKMMADAYMASLGKKHPELQINSCDPGLVYTDLILKMPKYDGQTIEESGAQTPKQGVEAAMRLLFDEEIEGSGNFYAMNKDKSKLLKSTIDVKPSE